MVFILEENNVYELAKTLQHTKSMEEEIQGVLQTLKDTVQKKYLQQASDIAKSQKYQSSKNPPKEVTLLSALTPFMPAEYEQNITQINRQLMLLQNIQSISQNMNRLSSNDMMLHARSKEESAENPSPELLKLSSMLLMISLLDEF